LLYFYYESTIYTKDTETNAELYNGNKFTGGMEMKKVYILVLTLFITFIIVLISFSINKESHPFDALTQMRDNVENYKVIATKETKNGTLVYSVGKVNNDNDNMYFVDMVKDSFMGYKWLGGGGHINHDTVRQGESFVLSAQLLNENQNITPTLFGVFSDEKINKVTVKTRDGLSDSIIYNGNEASEKLYVAQFQNNVSNYQYFMFIITLKDGNKINYVVPDDEIAEFQQGHQIYLYKEQFN